MAFRRSARVSLRVGTRVCMHRHRPPPIAAAGLCLDACLYIRPHARLFIGAPYVVMAYVVMAYIVMAHIVMACMVMALYSYGPI